MERLFPIVPFFLPFILGVEEAQGGGGRASAKSELKSARAGNSNRFFAPTILCVCVSPFAARPPSPPGPRAGVTSDVQGERESDHSLTTCPFGRKGTRFSTGQHKVVLSPTRYKYCMQCCLVGREREVMSRECALISPSISPSPSLFDASLTSNGVIFHGRPNKHNAPSTNVSSYFIFEKQVKMSLKNF